MAPELIRDEADGGFVEDEEVGLVDKRVGEAHALTVTFGKVADDFLSGLGEAAEFEDITNAFA